MKLNKLFLIIALIAPSSFAMNKSWSWTPVYKQTNPLMRAITTNDTELVKLLLEKGANPNDVDKSWPHQSAFEYASSIETPLNPEILVLLLKHGAMIGNGGKDAIFRIFDRGKPNIELIKLLFEKGVNPNTRNQEGKTLLMHIAEEPQRYGYEPYSIVHSLLYCAHLLLERGADPNIPDNEGKTTFDHAVYSRLSVPLLRMMAEKHPFPFKRDKDGRTYLLQAMMAYREPRSAIPLMQFLLEKGDDIYAVDQDGNTVLTWATYNYNPNMACLLIDHARKLPPAILEKGQIQKTSYLNLLPTELMQLASHYLQNDLYRLINHANNKGETPLMIAAKKWYNFCLEMEQSLLLQIKREKLH
jgi:ankyrin repeat protein